MQALRVTLDCGALWRKDLLLNNKPKKHFVTLFLEMVGLVVTTSPVFNAYQWKITAKPNA